MFKLIDYATVDAATKGIGVAGRHTDGTWHLAIYDIPVADDPDTWIAANQAQIEADLPTGKLLNTADLARHAIKEGWITAADVIPDLDDIADIHEEPQSERIIKAFALVVLDEVNALRTFASLPLRTIEQLKNAMKNKLQEMS